MSKVDISRARVQRLIDMDAVPNYVVAELLNEVERLQSSITGAMDHLSNGNVEAGARLLRECFWGTAQETPAGHWECGSCETMNHADNDECCHCGATPNRRESL